MLIVLFRNQDAAGQALMFERDLSLGLPLTFIMVFFIVVSHTRSVFCGTVVLLFVGLSMGCGYIGYYGIMRLAYFDNFLTLTLFVMLAVGADDFFVIWEATKLARGDFVGVTNDGLGRLRLPEAVEQLCETYKTQIFKEHYFALVKASRRAASSMFVFRNFFGFHDRIGFRLDDHDIRPYFQRG